MTEILASDTDRDRVAERLREAAAEGRITAEELEERLERAFSARTEAELEPLVADLPAPTRAAPQRRRRRRGPDADHLRAYLAVSVMLVAIWALTGAGYFWPIWPIMGWGIGVIAERGGSLRGPCGRRSSSRGSSTARLRSSPGAARGSGGPVP